MSEAELTEDQLKEQKLEAARKKYEELKKKNKKKKNKKKSTEAKEDGSEPDADADAEKPDGEGKEEQITEDEKQLKDEVEQATEEVKEDTKSETEPVSEDSPAKAQEQPEKKTVGEIEAQQKPESAREIEEEEEAKEEPLDNNEDFEIDTSEIKKEIQSSVTPVEEITEPSKNLPTGLDSQQVDSLFGGDSGPSFLETIEDSKLQEEVKSLQAKNSELSRENETLKKDIKAFKLEKFDQLDQIETLEQRVKDLEAKLARAQVDVPQQSQYHSYDDERLTLSPTPSYQQPFNTNFTNFNQNEKTKVEDIKARLSKWKGWNLDMSGWRSIGGGPIVEL